MNSPKIWVLPALLFLVAGCGVSLDLKNLTFAPEDAGAGDDLSSTAETTAGDLTSPGDVTAETLVPQEVTSVDQVQGMPRCWDLFNCVLYDETAMDLNESAFNKCGGSTEWKSESAVIGLRGCLLACMVSSTLDEFMVCLGGDCLDDTLQCLNDEDGTKSCADASYCATTKCNQLTEGTSDQANCMIECFSDVEHTELAKLEMVLKSCGETQSDSGQCQKAIQECYAGSGDNTCPESLECFQGCDDACPKEDDPGNDEPPDCPEKELCFVNCLYGISEDASQLITGMSVCSYDKNHNPFKCIKSGINCYYDTLSGLQGCKQVAAAIYGPYKNYDHPECYNTMFFSALQIKHAHVNGLLDFLGCLEGEWEKKPGYGQIGALEWNKCVDNCK